MIEFSLLLLCITGALAPPPLIRGGKSSLFGVRSVHTDYSRGGDSGEKFDDMLPYNNGLPLIIGIDAINISFGGLVESIQVTYRLYNGSLYTAPRHGGNKTRDVTIQLAEREYVVKIEGMSSREVVSMLTIHTTGPNSYEEKVYGPFGERQPGHEYFGLWDGYYLSLFGNAGDLLNEIGCYYLNSVYPSRFFGSNGSDSSSGRQFDENPDRFVYPPTIKITSISVHAHNSLNSLQFSYLLLNGETIQGERHGTSTGPGKTEVVNIGESEAFCGIEGDTDSNSTSITSLTIHTRSKYGIKRRHGPFGGSGPKHFTVDENLMGYWGYFGQNVSGLEFYFVGDQICQ